jgi:hypothetical protein
MIDLLIRLLPYIAPAIRYADDLNRSYWNVPLIIYTAIVYVADMIVAHLYFAPAKYEWTVSHVLERTHTESLDALRLALAINAISPGHIKSLLKTRGA